MTFSQRLVCCAIALIMCAPLPARGEEFKNPKANIPPKATPQRRNAGEGAPPLPLPATPLRRSEKKREPKGRENNEKTGDHRHGKGLTRMPARRCEPS